jgi:hypothetical protein
VRAGAVPALVKRIRKALNLRVVWIYPRFLVAWHEFLTAEWSLRATLQKYLPVSQP